MGLARFFGVGFGLVGIGIFLANTGFSEEHSSEAAARAEGCAIPLSEQFGWPKAASELYNLATGGDLDGQRAHAWSLFQAATLPAFPNTDSDLPIFHTWYGEDETFSETSLGCEERVRNMSFEPSTQFLAENPNPISDVLGSMEVSGPLRFDPDPTQFSGTAIPADVTAAHATFSHVAFNQELFNYIQDNEFYRRSNLLAYSDPTTARTPLPAPPRRSASLKMGWWPVAATEHSAVPVWDFDPEYPGREKNPPWTWKRVVAVDASGQNRPIDSIEYAGRDFANPNVVSLEDFYHVTLTGEEAQNANDNWRLRRTANAVLGRNLRGGDHVVMVALHINTAEYQPWVYTTFWWHDNPDGGKWADGRPGSLDAPWSNYLMGAAFNINEPREQDDHAYIVQNPYLELFQKGGLISNCMACHARSAVHPSGMPAGYDPDVPGTTDPLGLRPIPFGSADRAFDDGTVFLNTIWTLKTRSN